MKTSNGFIFENAASYHTDDIESQILYEYNYFNGKILLKANKFGVESAQYLAPSDIMLLNSNKVNAYSEWNVWIKKGKGRFHNNFACPNNEKPIKATVTYYPDHAEYYCEYKGFSVLTTLLVALDDADIVMKVCVTNKTDKTDGFVFIPSVLPYLNKAALALWDEPEWYVKTGVRRKSGHVDFYSRLFNPAGDVTKRRAMTYSIIDNNVEKVVINKALFIGNGDYFHPELSLKRFSLNKTNLAEDFDDNPHIVGVPSVYGAVIEKNIAGGESYTFYQVLSMQNKERCGDLSFAEIERSHNYLSAEVFDNETELLKKYYKQYFALRSIHTFDKELDYFVNGFLPLELFWVCGLDRGWPTGMQGTRDSANDFMAMLYYHPERARKQLVHLYSCMRSDGWMPRQVSTLGVHGEHDLRNYCDSTAALQEFLYEYICVSGDIDVLKEKVTWLDNDNISDIESHMFKGLYYYLDENNIGEHGLCKIYAGDWLDPINLAGVKGRGESVMVSCLVFKNLINAVQLLKYIDEKNYSKEIKVFNAAAYKLKKAINKYAFNGKGFYNGMFTDDGFWIFSDNDPDGHERFYASSNYFAVSCGVADKKRTLSVLKYAEKLKGSFGYKIFSPAFNKHINGVGRVASGDMAPGLWENGAVYSQSSNCFRARALAKAHRANKLFEAVKYALPYDKKKHDMRCSLGSPYAIVNCYHNLECAKGLSGRKFLTGSVGMLVRIIYCDMFGVNCKLGGIIFNPCLTKDFDGATLSFKAKGKEFFVNYKYGDKRVYFNNQEITESTEGFFAEDGLFKDKNIVNVYYK